MALTEKQKRNLEGIVSYINDFLDKRFAQARRVNSKVGIIEPDLRWHQIGTVRLVLSGWKAFGTLKLIVADLLCSADEDKKRNVFHPDNQASIMNEIIPLEDDSKRKEKRVGQLEINDIKTFYKALDPSLEKIVELLQCWIWWDLRDAAELYRFDLQAQRLEDLKMCEITQQIKELYQHELGVKPDVNVTREQMLQLELTRTKDIVEKLAVRVGDEHGYQMIIVNQEKEGTPEADALCMRLAKRLAGMDRIRSQQSFDEPVRQYYSQQLGIPTDQVTAEAVLELERKMARLDRQSLSEKLLASHGLGESFNYKQIKLDEVKQRFVDLCGFLGVDPAEVGRKVVEEGKKDG